MTKPSINWDHVAKHIVAMATNDSDITLMYVQPHRPPKKDDAGWPAIAAGVAHNFASFIPGTCDWRDSLVIRPGYEETGE